MSNEVESSLMNLRLVMGGLKSFLPLRPAAYKGTGGSMLGAYCYSVWFRHRHYIERAVPGFRPRVVVELGPGDSIGLGLAALLDGAERYHGLDILEHASVETNLRVLDELAQLFRRRAPVPGVTDFPHLLPALPDYCYPAALADGEGRDERISDAELNRLREVIRLGGGGAGSRIAYSCPWNRFSVAPGSANLVITQVALQDMDHEPARDTLRGNLAAMAEWLCPGGVMSHQIDFSCPGDEPWNHHWGYGGFAWSLIRGNRPYYVNRAPLSEYLRILDELGCDVVHVEPSRAPGLPRASLARAFRSLPETDLSTRASLVIAVKRKNCAT